MPAFAAPPGRARAPLFRLAAALACALAALPAARAADQEDVSAYPSHLIRIVVPYTAGSIGDLFIRPLAQKMGQELGQSVIIENKPGASQAIGAVDALQSAPDGYTLFMGTQSGFVLSRAAHKKLPFDPEKDFTPVSMLFTSPMFLFVSAKVPAKTVPELIALAKKEPGKLTFASIGPGTAPHLSGEMFKTMAGVDLMHVPYKGGPEATTAVVTGQVDVLFNGGNSLPQMQRGQIRALATLGTHRWAKLPDLPTLDELGLKGYNVDPWFGLFAPAGTPRAIVDKLNAVVTKALKTQDMQDRADSQGLEVLTSTPEELGRTLKADTPVWTKIMRQAGIQPE